MVWFPEIADGPESAEKQPDQVQKSSEWLP
jgi:hypothetical protein